MSHVLGALFGLVLLVAGGFVLKLSYESYLEAEAFLARALTAPGMVIDLEPDNEGDLHAIVEFTPAEGDPRKFRSGVSGTPRPYDVGDSVVVLYDPGDASKAEIKGRLNVWGGSIVFGIIGGSMAWGGLMILLNAF